MFSPCTPSFIKMHGLGNDFVLIDARDGQPTPAPAQIRAMADRHRGIGFDQLIVIEPPQDARHALRLAIFNADGGRVGACGNASRCIARWHADTTGCSHFEIETDSGVLSASTEAAMVTLDMGRARHDWRDIPLSKPQDTLHINTGMPDLPTAVGVNVGNPHLVFFVDDVQRIPLADWGARLEQHPLFPERINVEFAQVLNSSHLRVRVWERGAGMTQACGTGACAVAVAGVRRGLCARDVTITLDGGDLTIIYGRDDHVIMRGSASYVYRGQWLDDKL